MKEKLIICSRAPHQETQSLDNKPAPKTKDGDSLSSVSSETRINDLLNISH